MKTWVVVASAARARVFEVLGRREPWREVLDLLNPEDRLQPQDMQSDRPGRSFDSLGGQRHAMESPTDPKQQAAMRFAKRLADQLDADRHAGRFEALCVVAPPRFLGLLREHMADALGRTVTAEVTKDFTREYAAAVQAELAELL